jgi:flagellar biosynthetic protein FliR
MEELLTGLKYYLLIGARISAVIILLPGFSSNAFPFIAKIFVIIALTLITGLNLTFIPIAGLEDNAIFALYVIKEIVIGLMIGFFSQLPFMAARTAGDIISFKTMFSMANVVDPSFGQRLTVWGQFYDIMALFVFFIINGHLILFRAILYSFEKISVASTLAVNMPILEKIVATGTSIIAAGVMIAAPVAVALLVSNFSMGLISRTMPQFNVFFIGIPLQIILAFLLIILTIQADTSIINNIFERMFMELNAVLRIL